MNEDDIYRLLLSAQIHYFHLVLGGSSGHSTDGQSCWACEKAAGAATRAVVNHVLPNVAAAR
jgi:hypothetical protein